MEQSSEPRDRPLGEPIPAVDRVISDEPVYGVADRARYRTVGPAVAVDENVMPVRNRVQWGPIVAGALISLGTLVLMAVLGVAIGASAFEPGTDLTDWGTGAGIYGGISLLVALFIGGWVAAKTAAVGGSFAGLMNGLLAGATAIVALIVLSSMGLSNVLGFLGGNLQNIADYASDVATGTAPAGQANDAFNNIENGAWGTLIALVLGFGAAALGGLAGHNSRTDLIEGTGRDD